MAVDDALDPLDIRREKMEIRINRCDTDRDDVFYAWVGLNGTAPRDDIAEQLRRTHDQWRSRGWTITRFRTLESGGVNLAATDPATGNSYSLDSGFDIAPDAAFVGFFSTPCFRSDGGVIDFGEIELPDS